MLTNPSVLAVNYLTESEQKMVLAMPTLNWYRPRADLAGAEKFDLNGSCQKWCRCQLC